MKESDKFNEEPIVGWLIIFGTVNVLTNIISFWLGYIYLYFFQ